MLHLKQSKHIEVSLHGKIRKNKLYSCSYDKCGYILKPHKDSNLHKSEV